VDFFRTTLETTRAYSRQPCKPVFPPDEGYMIESDILIFGTLILFISRAALSVASSWASAVLFHRGVILAGRQRRFHSDVASSAVAHLLGLPARADIAPKVNR